MPVTIKDIAAELGISATTVSRSLKNDERISKEVRERVTRLAQKMGYRPNLMAKSLVSNRTDTIGFLVDNLSWSFFSELAECIQNAAEKHHYSVFIYSSQKSAERERAGVERFLSRGIDGLLIFATEAKENNEYYSELSGLGIPVVFFNHFNHLSVNCVTTDDYDGARKALRHLLELGHRRIGYIGSREDSSFKRQRLGAYRDALAEAGASDAGRWVALEEDDPLYGYRVAKEWLTARDERPTAIFAQNDLLAFGACRAIAELGLRVPDDVSIIGFDDLDTCQFMHPPLTTVKIPLRQLADAAIRFLIERIGSGSSEDEEVRLKTTLSPNLIVRQSTAPAPK
ncbi:LacI family DNA-binding transcriptional regulator [Cohnella zeiphila]|uniref:LacI family DNA-binding transcriptional regulator n=1 Tax=Cohnella zeiphila TaxID=2761120 RepID=A0A7X0VYZ1_9BACL|nr:LacI family DNA-binding transcriptional regulator [Cohnella zeiphila]MBB6733448.1 LacI family DNA-binding transcriptional regulator [Cohnella zeiphila]